MKPKEYYNVLDNWDKLTDEGKMDFITEDIDDYEATEYQKMLDKKQTKGSKSHLMSQNNKGK